MNTVPYSDMTNSMVLLLKILLAQVSPCIFTNPYSNVQQNDCKHNNLSNRKTYNNIDEMNNYIVALKFIKQKYVFVDI